MGLKTIDQLLKGSASASNEEIVEVLLSVAEDFGDVIEDVSSLMVEPLKGGMTNQVFQISWPIIKSSSDDDDDGNNNNVTRRRRVVVRLYGEGVVVFFNREIEIKTFEWMSKYGHGPRLLATFTNGRVEEFLHARTLRAADLRDPEISALIAAKMREFHNVNVPGAKEDHIWQRLRNMLNHAKRLCSPKDAMSFGLDTLDAEIDMLEKVLLSDEYQEIGFCHNDPQYNNIMFDEEKSSITFIDYEFASHNHIAYDLAYHFCEMEVDYHSDNPHIVDYSKYPGLEERQRFIFIYLSSDGKKPSNIEVERLTNVAEKYTLACHLFYVLWGLLWNAISTADFNCKEFARLRLEQYWSKKITLLDSSTNISPNGIVNI